jgi:uncharacterized small protein (DUF1192 family)
MLGFSIKGDTMVTVSRGEVVGIGKVKIPRTPEFNYEIPMLSFLVSKGNEGGYASSCIHLCMDGYGDTEEGAVNSMIEHITGFLKMNFEKLPPEDAWYNLQDLSRCNEVTSEYWNAYRDVQWELARRGIATDSVEALKKRIAQLRQRVAQLEAENRELSQKRSGTEELILDYISFKAAA